MSREIPWFGIAVLLAVLVIGFAMVAFGVRNMLMASKSKNWPTAQGLVEHSTVGSDLDDDHRMRYAAKVRYEYKVDSVRYRGRSFAGDRIGFGSYDFRDKSEAEAVVERYPAGAQVTVYYDPDNGANAVLEPGGSSGKWQLIVAGLVFLVLGFFFLWMITLGRGP